MKLIFLNFSLHVVSQAKLSFKNSNKQSSNLFLCSLLKLLFYLSKNLIHKPSNLQSQKLYHFINCYFYFSCSFINLLFWFQILFPLYFKSKFTLDKSKTINTLIYYILCGLLIKFIILICHHMNIFKSSKIFY